MHVNTTHKGFPDLNVQKHFKFATVPNLLLSSGALYSVFVVSNALFKKVLTAAGGGDSGAVSLAGLPVHFCPARRSEQR